MSFASYSKLPGQQPSTPSNGGASNASPAAPTNGASAAPTKDVSNMSGDNVSAASQSTSSSSKLSAANLAAHNAKFMPQTAFNAPESVHAAPAHQASTFPRKMAQRKPGIPHKQMTIQLASGKDDTPGRTARGESTDKFQDIWPPALYTEDSEGEDEDEEQSLATNLYADISGPAAHAEGEPSHSMSYYQ